MDDVGCTVAHQPGGSGKGAHLAGTDDREETTTLGSRAAPAWGSSGGGAGGIALCHVRPDRCGYRLAGVDCAYPQRRCASLDPNTKQPRTPSPAAHEHAGLAQMLAGLHGKLDALRRELWGAGTAPAPLPDNVAQEVFAVVEKFEVEGRWRKAPIIRVFRLYCVKGMSVSVVARRCECSRSLVFLRLEQLRRRLGRNPAELRVLSSQFEQLEDSIRDPRARRIYREALADEVGE